MGRAGGLLLGPAEKGPPGPSEAEGGRAQSYGSRVLPFPNLKSLVGEASANKMIEIPPNLPDAFSLGKGPKH